MSRYCNKCGYHGPDMSHQNPITGNVCNYYAAESTNLEVTMESLAFPYATLKATKPQEPIGYDDIFNAIAEAASPCGEGIGVSVMAFKRVIGGEIFLSPTIPQWQPIETAPKDGSRLMLLFPGDRQEFGYWDDQRYNKNPAPYWNGDCDRVFGVRYYRAKQPTHWMPLPPPPAGVMK